MARRIKTGGRRRGTPNRITASFREAVQIVYDGIGGHAAFAAWASENPTDFYRIAARLIPVQIAQSKEPPRLVITIAPTPTVPAERELVSLPPALVAR